MIIMYMYNVWCKCYYIKWHKINAHTLTKKQVVAVLHFYTTCTMYLNEVCNMELRWPRFCWDVFGLLTVQPLLIQLHLFILTCPYIINMYTCMPFCFDRRLLKTKRIKISKNVFATVFVHVQVTLYVCICF